MEVYVDKPKCTGCAHCHDVCPVGVFEMVPLDAPMEKLNADKAPPEAQWKGQHDQTIYQKWNGVSDGHNHFKEKSVAVNSDACILCQACLIECEGECITITDDSGNKYQSIYK